jgi:hypothetical protein
LKYEYILPERAQRPRNATFCEGEGIVLQHQGIIFKFIPPNHKGGEGGLGRRNMWPQPITKESCLPVVKKPFGFVQRSSYLHPDLYDEEVVEVEMDSPWVSQVRVGTQVYTFVLLGDQNAGKSTFLHGFTYAQDNHWPEIASVLPILSSSFINTRFSPNTIATDGDEGDADAAAGAAAAGQPPATTTTSPKVASEWLPRDELPFLDTDVARSHILLTRDDFAFWIDEVGLPLPSEILPPELVCLMFWCSPPGSTVQPGYRPYVHCCYLVVALTREELFYRKICQHT